MALFKKKENVEKSPAKGVAPEAEKSNEKLSAPSLRSIQAAPSKAKSDAVTTTPSAKKAAAVKASPAKKTASEATATKAPTTKSTATKPTAPKSSAAKPGTKVPAKKTATAKPATAARPFFMQTTEDDIREAFDQAIAEADAEILKNKGKAVGKYEFDLEVDGYHFYLIANNGQVLFDSPSFTTLLGALGGIKTFQKTVAEGNFDIKVDKYNRYRFILARKYYGENYTTREQCVKCVESVKNFANNAKILRFVPDRESVTLFEAARSCKRTPNDIDWKAVEKAEAQATKMGKWEVYRESEKQFCFYLVANNGQILYSSRYYATEKACRDGIESFKRAAYVGNFFVDRDKFGNYRYVLKNIGSAPAFIGESYDNKLQCEKIIDSVKKFIVTATVDTD
ncbi:MAG: DUF1508 domain-containing protein [Ruminococcaceae bacterium]|nr:DUF1508 domain-containing protein [Oscillospiraceae bacterium]